MTTQSAETASENDPVGSIFLPKDQLIDQFLSLQGDPENILEKLMTQTPDSEIPELVSDLDRRLLLSRGGVKMMSPDIHPEADQIEFDRGVGERLRHGEALMRVLGRLAQSV